MGLILAFPGGSIGKYPKKAARSSAGRCTDDSRCQPSSADDWTNARNGKGSETCEQASPGSDGGTRAGACRRIAWVITGGTDDADFAAGDARRFKRIDRPCRIIMAVEKPAYNLH